MFVSSSPTYIIPPTSVKSVTYKIHESFRNNKIKKTIPPFLLPRRGWGYFTVNIIIELKDDIDNTKNNFLKRFSRNKNENQNKTIITSHSIHK